MITEYFSATKHAEQQEQQNADEGSLKIAKTSWKQKRNPNYDLNYIDVTFDIDLETVEAALTTGVDLSEKEPKVS